MDRGWEITAFVDRRGNRWRAIKGNRLQLISHPSVKLGRQLVELDYGPLRATEVDDVAALIDECNRWRTEAQRTRRTPSGSARSD